MKHVITTVLLAMSLLGAGSTVAATQTERTPAREQSSYLMQRISLDQAVGIAQQNVPGRVVGADTRHMQGRIIHEVRILENSGTLRIIRVDGETGRVLR